jgi:hypothetical protein
MSINFRSISFFNIRGQYFANTRGMHDNVAAALEESGKPRVIPILVACPRKDALATITFLLDRVLRLAL